MDPRFQTIPRHAVIDKAMADKLSVRAGQRLLIRVH
jgi:hypothetical protein